MHLVNSPDLFIGIVKRLEPSRYSDAFSSHGKIGSRKNNIISCSNNKACLVYTIHIYISTTSVADFTAVSPRFSLFCLKLGQQRFYSTYSSNNNSSFDVTNDAVKCLHIRTHYNCEFCLLLFCFVFFYYLDQINYKTEFQWRTAYIAKQAIIGINEIGAHKHARIKCRRGICPSVS